jgi:hypothetical protein
LTIVATAACGLEISAGFAVGTIFADVATFTAFAAATVFGVAAFAGFKALRAAGFAATAFGAAFRAGAFVAFAFTTGLVFAFAKVRVLCLRRSRDSMPST